MKRFTLKAVSLLLALAAVFAAAQIGNVGVSASADRTVIEVSSWEELSEAFAASRWDGAEWKIVLVSDLTADARDALRSQTALYTFTLDGCSVIFDFNGHTLSCNDSVSTTDLSYSLNDFIRVDIYLSERRTLSGFERYGSTLTVMDSVGGGGINMYSSRAKDNAIAAFHVVSHSQFYAMGQYNTDSAHYNNLVIESGSFYLDCKTEKFGSGTLNLENPYRGCVIADDCITVINGGYFRAKGTGFKSGDDDMCARELSAFGTCCSTAFTRHGIFSGETVINGGVFVSNGYSVHHFDLATAVNETTSMFFPMINGGIFSGSVGFVGMTFKYNDGNSELRSLPASTILDTDAVIIGIIGSDNVFKGAEGVTLGDLHKCRSLLVIGATAVGFRRASENGEHVELERCTEDSEEFSVEYSIPSWVSDYIPDVTVSPYITIFYNNTDSLYSTGRLTVEYASYPGELSVHAGVSVSYMGCNAEFEDIYDIRVTELKEPPVIVTQPVSVKAEPGGTAVLSVTADHAAAYQWYVRIGSMSIPITEALAGDSVKGYNASRLYYTAGTVTSDKFFCRVTGSDGTTADTSVVTVTFGSIPRVKSFSGGGYHAGGSAYFHLRADYLDNVAWVVYDRRASSDADRIRTLDDFLEDTGLECSVKQNSSFGYASVEFKNVPENFSGRYEVGYQLKNALGEIPLSLENCITFTLVRDYPVITLAPTDAGCFPGGELVFRTEALGATGFEWLFEIPDEDGVNTVMTVSEFLSCYPDVSADTDGGAGVSVLTLNGAVPEMSGIYVYCRVDGPEASSFTPLAEIMITYDYLLGDLTGDGIVSSADAIYLLRHVLFTDDYLLNQPCDFCFDGAVNSSDAVYLLRHVLFESDYPLG
ncbi:MAG: dockerin type I repeat-containing protein [Clostridia bacterium]|nr:dockerin type I repeat-containing protein [Clostridia bacterium]